ncbi:MAG: tryptophan-rich sensory protein [Flavobacteriaceae bacterium]|nr:tryptophan-rich sensory protein [Flavobacteriaceae bacterium]MDG1791272.1 tryptophan-rich sensory protein [Flavobacteriaceae bacterium]MDG2447560.1 tryptophan-rich sensory protein [Flavobacteriaceae bacterium]
MKFLKLCVVFLFLNFSALAFGSWLMDNGPMKSWYIDLNQAPWTPPGWVFGVAWTTIMICFSVYLAQLFKKSITINLILLYSIQLVLNISWNYIFFNLHAIGYGLACIVALTVIVFLFLISYRKLLQYKSLLIVPYFLWLLIATSLNAYIYFYN